MSKKLFAMESEGTEGTEVELDVSPEAGEVADVQVETEADAGEMEAQATAIDEGTEAADQMEQVEELVSEAAEGEGLDPIAAEAVRLAVEAICSKVGANPKAVYSLYATENFQSASSRKANTRIALEGVAEFLKDLWKKIKSSLENLWTKVKAFWDKHVSTLGRVKKALESMKDKVSESSGKLKDKAYIEEAPASLVEAFAGKKDINKAVVDSFIATHTGLTAEADKLSTEVGKINAAVLKSDENLGGFTKFDISFGTDQAGLIGGSFITYSLEKEDEGGLDVTVDRGVVSDKESKLGVSILDKADVQATLKATLEVIVATIKRKDKVAKNQADFNKTMLATEKAVNAPTVDAGKVKALRDGLKIMYKVNAKTATVDNEIMSANIKLAKAVLGYAALCVKNYK